MANIMSSILDAKFSRRDFLKGTMAATAAVAGLGLLPKENALAESTAPVEHPPIADQEEGGKWVSAACWHNCGGRCINLALVKDGVVLRQKTDDTHEDSPDFPQQRACVRGRAQRQHVLSPDRLKYPMKRKNWNPGDGEKHMELRGQDEWERLSWDEAIEMCADEIHRIVQKYGNENILVPYGGECQMVMSKVGGYRYCWGTNSRGTYTSTPGKVGFWPQANEGINDRIELRKSDIVIMHGCNPAWSSAGSPAYHLLQIKKHNPNAKFISIDPLYNDSAALVEAEWIPIRPSTDTAFLLGLAYTIYTLDQAGEDLMDWDFLNTHTLGFDMEHMPADAEEGAHCFKEYLLGELDGQPKDAAWASEICGVPVEKFEYLARLLSKENKVAYLTSWAQARTHNADNLPQLHMTLGAMTGHFGKSGHCWGVSAHSRNINGGYYLCGAGGAGNPSAKNPLENASINDTECWAACKKGVAVHNYYGAAGVEVPIDLKMVYWGYTAFLNTREGTTAGIEVLRSMPEFVLSHSMFRTTNAKYSDIVLPVTTPWEKAGSFLQGNREALIMATKVIEPLYEAKNDQEIANLICAKLFEKYGEFYPDLTADPVYPLTEEQQFMNAACGCWYLDENREKKTLLTITAEQKAAYGVEGEDQEGLITFDEFMEKGLFQIPRADGDNYGYIAWQDFREDVNTNAAAGNSASGLMEIYSQGLKDMVNAMKFSDIEAYPTWIPQEDGYPGTFKDGDIHGEKGEFPLQIYNPHYLRRSHTDFDNVGWLREAWPNPVFLSKTDADEAGIMDGDTVQITSPHGSVLRNACVTNRLMPGVVALPHGTWSDMDEKLGVDRGGTDNVICGGISTGAGASGWNTGRCNIRKFTEYQLPADVDRSDMQERILF